MSLTRHFEKLGAPLKNSRWSWGSVRAKDGAVFLRVWQDQRLRLDGKSYMRVTHHAKFTDNESNLGYQERLEQIDLVRQGSQLYMIICVAKDVEARPREIERFISDDIFVAGELIDHEGDTWAEVVDRIDRLEVQ